MSQRQGLKRRISLLDGPDGKKVDRRASPPGDVFNTGENASGDAHSNEINSYDTEINSNNATRSRGGIQRNYIESEDDSEEEKQKNKQQEEDEAEYLPSTSRAKSRHGGPIPLKKNKPAVTEEELKDAMKTLRIRDEDMEALCLHFKIPYAVDRRKRGEGDTFYTASTITSKILKEYGWDFDDDPRYTKSKEDIEALYDIVPEGSAESIGMIREPVFFVYTDSATSKKPPRVFQSRVVENIDRLGEVLRAEETKLTLPKDWGVKETIGEKPTLPEQFQTLSRHLTPAREIPKEPMSTPASAISQPTPYRQRAENRVISQLSSIIEKTRDSDDSDAASESGSLDHEPESPKLPFDAEGDSQAPILSIRSDQSGSESSSSELTELDAHSPDVQDDTIYPESKISLASSGDEGSENSEAYPSGYVSSYNVNEDDQLLAIPTFDEALELWDRWKPMFHEKNIGDIIAAHLNLLTSTPGPSEAARLEAWIKPFEKIHAIKKTIARLQLEIGTYDERKKKKSSSHPHIAYRNREMIVDMGLTEKNAIKGDITINEHVNNVANSAARVVYRWITFEGLEDDDTRTWNEMDVESRFGRLIPGIFYGSMWKEFRCQDISFPSLMRPFDTTPRPDYAVRASGVEWEHFPEKLRPVLLSADAKTEAKDVIAQLAMNSIGTLVLFIFMYLDTRIKPEGRVSGVSWIPAIVYNEVGFRVYAHYPKLVLKKDGDWSWRFGSRLLTDAFVNAWQETIKQIPNRAKGLDAMARFRTHASLVNKALLDWTKYDRSAEHPLGATPEGRRLLDQLIARAYWEAGDYEWIVSKAKEVSQNIQNIGREEESRSIFVT